MLQLWLPFVEKRQGESSHVKLFYLQYDPHITFLSTKPKFAAGV